MRKKILIVLSFILMLTLTACSKSTPTETVQSSFDQIKSEINSDDNIKNKTKSLVKTLSGDNVNSDTVYCLLKSLSKMNVQVNKENIKDDKATVSVKIKGINLKTAYNDYYTKFQKDLNLVNSLNDDNNEDAKKENQKLLIDSINNSELEERTVNLNLEKSGGTWTLLQDDNFSIALWGITSDEISKLTEQEQ